MMQWRKLQEEGRADERKDLDVEDKYNRYINYRNSEGLDRLSSTKKLLEWLKDNDARAEDGFEVFNLKDFTDVKPLDNIGVFPFFCKNCLSTVHLLGFSLSNMIMYAMGSKTFTYVMINLSHTLSPLHLMF